MKVTTVLCKHHIGRMTRQIWKVKSNILPVDCGTEAALAPYSLPITDPKLVLQQRLNKVKSKIDIEVVGLKDKERKRDESHPLYHERECYIYTNSDVLVKGLDQAKVITNTVEIQEGLPTVLTQPVGGTAHTPDLVKRCVESSNIFEAQMDKLPRYVDPERPYHHHARIWGITDKRKTELITLRLIQLCGALCGVSRTVVKSAPVILNINKDEDLLQLSVRGDMLLLDTERPQPLTTATRDAEVISLPQLGPIHPLISVNTDHFYSDQDVYPAGDRLYPHTLVLHGNTTEVQNLYETPVTETQWLGRSLLNTFAVGASHARRLYGDDVKDLPESVTLQCCQTDGRLFHFCVLQLNTLDIDSSSSRRNIWWSAPREPLFDFCGYQSGQPKLHGFNLKVFDTLLAFYTRGIKQNMSHELAA